MKVQERINIIIKNLNVTQYKFAKETGISQKTVSNLLAGYNSPSADVLIKIRNTYHISPNWILLGEGDMCVLPSKDLNNLKELPKESTKILKEPKEEYFVRDKEVYNNVKLLITEIDSEKKNLLAQNIIKELESLNKDLSEVRRDASDLKAQLIQSLNDRLADLKSRSFF